MSTFDIVPDAPGLLRTEAINVQIVFDRTGPTTGRVSWNIPAPAAGCTSDTQAYCGILITIDTTPASLEKTPKNGIVYSADPTADIDLFAGDLLGTSKVVGAFVRDRVTTTLDITGLLPNTAYYVSGYPSDCENRYFTQGVHAYSTEFKNRGTEDTSGTQVVVLNATSPSMGVLGTDGTGLDPLLDYGFKIQLGVIPRPNRPVDSVECLPTAPTYTISVSGADSLTYSDLVTAINKQFALLTPSVAVGSSAPNTNALYVNQNQVFKWNGAAYDPIDALVRDTDPTATSVGSLWYNPSTRVLNSWTGAAWTVTPYLALPYDPTTPTADVTYWFDGTSLWLYNGVTWCNVSVTAASTDPSLPPTIPGGSFWYSPATSLLQRWSNTNKDWTPTTAVQSAVDPTNLPVGYFWYNESTSTLFQYGTPLAGWNTVSTVVQSSSAPTVPAPSTVWYNSSTEQLWTRNPGNTAWIEQEVIVFPVDPTNAGSCNIWWDTTLDVIKVRNTVTNVWVTASSFFQTEYNPALPQAIVDGTVWYNITTQQYFVWGNQCFTEIFPTLSATNPQLVADGTIWLNTGNARWYRRTAGAWTLVTPVLSTTDPKTLSVGTLWFNPSGSLNFWNGLGWVNIAYSNTSHQPSVGTLWYNTTSNMLMVWSGLGWIRGTAVASVELDCNGNLLFTDNTKGSTSFVKLTDDTLFQSLTADFSLHDTNPGTDGASDTPSYQEVGIGTNGDDSIRNAIINDIRYELGYPVVDVELTKEQLDYAVTRAVGVLRQHSSIAYKRGFFFMAMKPNEQKYLLTNKNSGMNKIVDVMGIYRLTSSFLSSAHGAGVYGQIVLQHMYNMGTFDLLSYHIMSEYTKLMEILFAARITYTWNEQSRELWIHHKFSRQEPMVCIEATVERTEQDIMSDRYAQPWIRRYATALARIMLAEIRGKFSSLPGAGGNITLNADTLRNTAQTDIEACMKEIDDLIVERPEEYGVGSVFVFG